MKQEMALENHLDVALRAALDAGREILEIYNGGELGIQTKQDLSPLTLADTRSHRLIQARLEDTGIPVLSEEGTEISFELRSPWERYWLVDPLDGTKEFIKRNGEFTVNIALLQKEAEGYLPVFGAVFVPVEDRLYLGIFGEGAWRLEKALESGCRNIRDVRQRGIPMPFIRNGGKPFRVVISRSHNATETEEFIRRMEGRFGNVETVASGSSIKLCLVAEGSADIYPRLAPTMEWDTAAGDAVCRSCGCRVTGEDGITPLEYNKRDLRNPRFLASRSEEIISSEEE